jgi:hypothetical protein
VGGPRRGHAGQPGVRTDRRPQITSLALDSSGSPWIAYTDRAAVKLAIWDGGIWKTETAVDAEAADLGQLVVMKLDSKDRPHIAYFEVTNNRKLDGVVKYAVGTPR